MSKISDVIGNIVSGLVQHKKAVLITTLDKNPNTQELTIDENGMKIYVY